MTYLGQALEWIPECTRHEKVGVQGGILRCEPKVLKRRIVDLHLGKNIFFNSE